MKKEVSGYCSQSHFLTIRWQKNIKKNQSQMPVLFHPYTNPQRPIGTELCIVKDNRAFFI